MRTSTWVHVERGLFFLIARFEDYWFFCAIFVCKGLLRHVRRRVGLSTMRVRLLPRVSYGDSNSMPFILGAGEVKLIY
jgi:hypothetical protein